MECGKPAAKRRVFHTERFKARSGRAAVETPERNGLGWGKLAGVFHGRQSTFGMGSNMPSRLRSGHARPQGLDSQVDGADGRERAHPRSDGLGHIGALSKSGKSVVWPQVGVRAGRYAVRPRGFCPHL